LVRTSDPEATSARARGRFIGITRRCTNVIATVEPGAASYYATVAVARCIGDSASRSVSVGFTPAVENPLFGIPEKIVNTERIGLKTRCWRSSGEAVSAIEHRL